MLTSRVDGFTNVLPSLTPLVGRERELARIQAMLHRAEVRLVTLTGPGGIGKTRLALEVTRQGADQFPDGTCVVSLAGIVGPDLVVGEIARACGLGESGERSLLDRLAEYLRPLDLLLLLDNLEHLLPDIVPAIVTLLSSCPTLRIIVTSRIPVHISGEREFLVPPLTLPDNDRTGAPDDLLAFDAIRLFIERAQAIDPDFALADDNASIITDICRRLDGLPLAIVLAAARLKALPPRELLRRLDRRLPLLTGGPRDLPTRQRTLRDAITWSYDLLEPEEQSLFRRLGVFAGGFTLEAAETVCDGRAWGGERASLDPPAQVVLEGVASLVDKSLLQQVPSVGGEGRYAMLESVREYALEHLAASPDDAAIRQRHGSWFLAGAERMWTAVVRGFVRTTWIDWAETEHDNIRAALLWFADSQSTEELVRLTGALLPFFAMHGHVTEWTQWTERCLPLLNQVPARVAAVLLQGAGHCAAARGQAVAGVARAEFERRALAAFQELNDPWGIAASWYGLGSDALGDGRYEEARSWFEQARASFAEHGDHDWATLMIHRLGEAAYGLGETDLAQQHFERSLTLHQAASDPWGIGLAHQYLGQLAIERGALADAARHFGAALSRWRELASPEDLSIWLARVAGLANHLKAPHSAAQLLGAHQAIGDRIGILVPLPARATFDEVRRDTRGRLGDAAYETTLIAGRTLTPDQAIAVAEDIVKQAMDSAAPGLAVGLHAQLTPRELQVLCLLTAGRTYPQVAEALFLSPATIRTHVQHIYAKLNIASRHDAAAYGREHGLC